VYFFYYNNKISKNNFNNVPTNYNIINYINEVEENIQEKVDNYNKNKLKNIFLYNTPTNITDNNISPNEVKQLGFSSCADAVQYFKNNNLNMFLQTNELSTPLAEICSQYLATSSKDNINDLQDFNNNLKIITNDINNNLEDQVRNLKPEIIINQIENRNLQFKNDTNFSNDKSVGFIYNYYQNKMKEQLNPNLIQYTDLIYGNFSIIPNQFIQLNLWDMQILSNQIKFLYLNTPIISYKYKFSNINTGGKFIYIKLLSYNILDNDKLNQFEIHNFISFLNDIGFKPDTFINITTVNNNVYAIKTSSFDTMFLIKEKIDDKRTNYQFDTIIN
jgi:hypothetical protein